MDNQVHNQIVSFIWGIADDCLRDVYVRGKYRDVILPMTVIRRLDAMLEETKPAVLTMKKQLDVAKIDNQWPALCNAAGQAFCNASPFLLKDLTSRSKAQTLKADFIAYLDGFSPNVQVILDKFKFRNQIDTMVDADILGAVIGKFTSSDINLSPNPIYKDEAKTILKHPGLDNHGMGTIFEELIRKFNEENNVTEAGEHFTPRDYVRLLADLAVVPVKEKLTDNTYTIYDGACGTGGILTLAQEEVERVAEEQGKNVKVSIFGQELQADTYATCKADLMISGNINNFSYRLDSVEHQYIAFGSTISQDGHAGERYDFCISNPPFGTPWKEDLKNWGLGDKKEVTDPRFVASDMSFIPDIGDCQMLFLANNMSRMKDTPLGTRIVEVHNGSSLFTGNAGGGESNLRRYIIENDLLEAIVAMPEKDFYNTGIATYVWVITNRKEERRRGYVQLIDASKICTPLRKNLGEKNCETTEDDRRRILQLLMDFKETPESKIFRNEEFGYWQVPVLRPKRDKEGNIVLKKGKVVMSKNRNEVEQIPLLYPGGIDAFYENEVKPYDAEAEFGEPVVGYELSFTKYFYKPVQLRSLSEIMADLNVLECETKGLWEEIMK